MTRKLGGRCLPGEEAAGGGTVWQTQLPVAAPGNMAMLPLAMVQLELWRLLPRSKKKLKMNGG